MKVILAETAGFCYGVERAVNLARETAKARGGAMLGSIVHNAGVVREIEDLGMRLITSPDQAKAGETVLIRAHGESRATLDALRERGAEVVSAVCPHVERIRKLAQEAEHEGRRVILLCPNHSTDLDPVLIGLCLPLDYHLHFMAKAELFDNRALAWLIRTLGAFPVQRDGKDIQSIKTAMQVLHKGENLLIFPEGTTIRGGVGYHDGLPAHAHAGIAMIGVRTGATLVPVFCDGQKKPFHKTRIIFGEPYVPEVTGRRGTSEELQAIADEMLRQAYALGGQQVGGAPL